MTCLRAPPAAGAVVGAAPEVDGPAGAGALHAASSAIPIPPPTVARNARRDSVRLLAMRNSLSLAASVLPAARAPRPPDRPAQHARVAGKWVRYRDRQVACAGGPGRRRPTRLRRRSNSQ